MDIFLSYSHLDKDFVGKLASDCKERGIQIWFDEDILLAGDSVILKIEEGIDKAKLFAIVLSQNSLESRWVREELEQAIIAAIAERRTKIIPIILGQVSHIPGFLRSKKYVDFSDWPHGKEQYNNSLNFLIRSIVEHKKQQAEQFVTTGTSNNLLSEGYPDRLLSNLLLQQLSLKYVSDWPLGKVFKGIFPVKKGYVDGSDRIWRIKPQSVQSLNQRCPTLKSRDNMAVRFLGEDYQGNPWCLINRELFVLLDEKWVGVPLSNMADSTRVSLWRDSPAEVVGPVVPLKNGVSILSSSGWRWNMVASPIGIPQATAGCKASLLIANSEAWATMRYPELIWNIAVRFPVKIPTPFSLFPAPSRGGFWVHCVDHTLFWVNTGNLNQAPLALGVKQGLPGARVDIAITCQEGEIWCAGSGGLAFTASNEANRFVILTDQTPQFLWADSSHRVWGLFNQEIRCWVKEEDLQREFSG